MIYTFTKGYMSTRQRKIKPDIKRALLAEAGGKCANPGCTNWRAHIHHIKHWAVYKTHDADHMIAVCPSCHDEIHYGKLGMDDATLYAWKGIKRDATEQIAQLFVEPSNKVRVRVGELEIATSVGQVTVFELSNRSRLSFRILDGDLLRISCWLYDKHGKEILRVVDNVVRVRKDKNIDVRFRSGRAAISVPNTAQYIPPWMVESMRHQIPDFCSGPRVGILDIHVLTPGIVQLRGIWADDKNAIVIFSDTIAFCQSNAYPPFMIVAYGEGPPPIIEYSGPITGRVFGFASQ